MNKLFRKWPIILAGMMAGRRYFCSFCRSEIFGFRDKPSAAEFRVSGLCQTCQDKTFAGGEQS
jgi:hypothetical protein